jgi:S-phase kinase-associated protein 1
MSGLVNLRPGDAQDDKDKVQIARKAAIMSRLIKEMLEEDEEDTPDIPLPNVQKEALLKVVEFCEKHANDPMVPISKPIKSTDMNVIVGEWDANYIDMEDPSLFAVILAANYLDIPDLLDLGCAKIASIIKNKSPDEIKDRFIIEKNSTPEEDEQVRRENPWIFEV